MIITRHQTQSATRSPTNPKTSARITPIPRNIPESLRPALHLPLYYIAFHGYYEDFTSTPPYFPILPKNCYLLETCAPGEVVDCEIDPFLWPTCNYEVRDEFLRTLGAPYTPPHLLTTYQLAIRSLRVNLPNTSYVPRHLSSENGRGARSFFQGVYKFKHNQPFSEHPPKGSAQSLYKKIVDDIIENDSDITTQKLIETILETDPDADEGAIFVVVTCAKYHTSERNKKIMNEIYKEPILSPFITLVQPMII